MNNKRTLYDKWTPMSKPIDNTVDASKLAVLIKSEVKLNPKHKL